MVRVKICGITSLKDAWAALDEGADVLGFVLVPGSPRKVSAGEARSIVRTLPPLAIAVGVFVDEEPGVVAEIAASCGFRFVQLHGDEPPAVVAAIGGSKAAASPASLATGVPVIKAFRVATRADLKAACGYRPSMFLLDSRTRGPRGGTGVPLVWGRFRRLALPAPVVLAGGLTPLNVRRAIRTVRPYAVDVSSGVESAPGAKDRALMRRFIRAARGA